VVLLHVSSTGDAHREVGMNVLRTLIMAALLLLFASCSTQRIPTMANPENGGIVIVVETVPPLGMILSSKPAKIYFVRATDKPGTYTNDVIPSNYTRSGRYYLLDVPPGRYAAVASFTREYGAKNVGKSSVPNKASGTSDKTASLKEILNKKGKRGYTTCFSKELVRLTETIVRPGQISLVGRFKVTQISGKGRGGKVYKGRCHYFGSRERHERDYAALASEVKKDLSGSRWGGLVRTE